MENNIVDLQAYKNKKDEEIESDSSFMEFFHAYVDCALWSSSADRDENDDASLESLNFCVEDLSEETYKDMRDDCLDFYTAHRDLIFSELELAGHDFWLTRNGHGAGFWDGDWDEPAATILDEASKPYGSYYLYLSEDEKIYHHG